MMSGSERARLMHKLADLIERDIEQLAALEAIDNGKPFMFAKMGDLPYVVKVLRYMAGLAQNIEGHNIPVDGPFMAYTRKEPVGVCA
jgi:acyl-CoA reductase-like NAD-dependent aldehyde dehydrogenase